MKIEIASLSTSPFTFPSTQTLVSCAVADDARGWRFPPLALVVHNPSSTSRLLWRVRATRPEEIFARPNRGVLAPGAVVELVVTPKPTFLSDADRRRRRDARRVDLADRESSDASFIENELAILGVSVRAGACDSAALADDGRSDAMWASHFAGRRPSVSVVRVRFDASGKDAASDAADALALREEAHATETRVRVAEHEYAIAAAEADALRRGAAMDDAVAEARRATAACRAAEAETETLRAELDAALREAARARREAETHEEAAANASAAAGAAVERLNAVLARAETERETCRADAKTEAERNVADASSRRRALFDAVVERLTREVASARADADAATNDANDAMERERRAAANLADADESRVAAEDAAGAATLDARIKTEMATRANDALRRARVTATRAMTRRARRESGRVALERWRGRAAAATATRDARRRAEIAEASLRASRAETTATRAEKDAAIDAARRDAEAETRRETERRATDAEAARDVARAEAETAREAAFAAEEETRRLRAESAELRADAVVAELIATARAQQDALDAALQSARRETRRRTVRGAAASNASDPPLSNATTTTSSRRSSAHFPGVAPSRLVDGFAARVESITPYGTRTTPRRTPSGGSRRRDSNPRRPEPGWPFADAVASLPNFDVARTTRGGPAALLARARAAAAAAAAAAKEEVRSGGADRIAAGGESAAEKRWRRAGMAAKSLEAALLSLPAA